MTATTSSSPVAWRPWFWPAALVVLVLDQLSKWWVFAQPRSTLPEWMPQHYNKGIAWSAFSNFPGLVALSTVILIPVLTVVWWRWYRPLGRMENLAFGLVLGGAVGNAIDRVLLVSLGWAEGVRDFISIDLRPVGISYIWPTFNIADAGISIGFVLLVIIGLRPQRSLAVKQTGAV